MTVKQVFISYAKEDAAFANQLAADLRQLSVNVWIASANIAGGQRWVAEIERGLQVSSHMLLVLTPAALSSRWVTHELDAAMRLEAEGRITLLPLLVKPCNLPLLLGNYHMVHFAADYQTGLRDLTHQLGIQGGPPTPTRGQNVARLVPAKDKLVARMVPEHLIGTVSAFYSHLSVATIELTDDLRVGDTVRMVGPGTNYYQRAESIQINRQPVTEARAGASVGLQVKQPVPVGSNVYKSEL